MCDSSAQLHSDLQQFLSPSLQLRRLQNIPSTGGNGVSYANAQFHKISHILLVKISKNVSTKLNEPINHTVLVKLSFCITDSISTGRGDKPLIPQQFDSAQV